MEQKKYYALRKEKARREAIEWQQEMTADGVNPSYADLARAAKYFGKLAKAYGLIKEFRENGIPC